MCSQDDWLQKFRFMVSVVFCDVCAITNMDVHVCQAEDEVHSWHDAGKRPRLEAQRDRRNKRKQSLCSV